MGFHRVFQTASRKQIGNLQNLSKLEKQAHHPNAKRNCLNPFLDQYIQCVIEVESAPNCRRQFGSLRRTPIAGRLASFPPYANHSQPGHTMLTELEPHAPLALQVPKNTVRPMP